MLDNSGATDMNNQTNGETKPSLQMLIIVIKPTLFEVQWFFSYPGGFEEFNDKEIKENHVN